MQDVCRETFRHEFHIVPSTLPQKAAVAKQIMNLKGLSRFESERIEIEINPACLAVEGIEIDDDDDDVGKIFGRLAVTNQRWIISSVEAKAVIALQRGILLANPIDPSDKVPSSSRPNRDRYA